MACGCKNKKKKSTKKIVTQTNSQTLNVGTKKTREQLIKELQDRLRRG